MPAVVGSTGSCDRARVVIVQATVLGRWMAVFRLLLGMDWWRWQIHVCD